MDQLTMSKYRAERARPMPTRARDALRVAKYRGLELDWKSSKRGIVQARFRREPFDVVVDVLFDEYPSQRVEETDTDTGIRNPRFNWSGDAWDTRNTGRFLSLESDTTVRELAEWYRKAGMSRNVAWETARASLQQEADEYSSDSYCEVIVDVRAFVADIELGRASVGGVETGGYENIESVAAETLVECALIEEATDEARDALDRLCAIRAGAHGEASTVGA